VPYSDIAPVSGGLSLLQKVRCLPSGGLATLKPERSCRNFSTPKSITNDSVFPRFNPKADAHGVSMGAPATGDLITPLYVLTIL
jgi:hypothetical protein